MINSGVKHVLGELSCFDVVEKSRSDVQMLRDATGKSLDVYRSDTSYALRLPGIPVKCPHNNKHASASSFRNTLYYARGVMPPSQHTFYT